MEMTMMQNELADTLMALIESIEAPPGSGLVVTEALLDVPLEIQGGSLNGKLVFLGSVPHTRWKSGVLPQIHMSHLRIALASQEDVTSLYMEDTSDQQ
jgi:hypothetical protein